MQLGLTWPLQRLTAQKPPPPTPLARVFCWDAHCITLRGRSTLLLVHCASRYACLRADMTFADWAALDKVARETVEEGLKQAGIPKKKIEQYFVQAGAAALTRTHGRAEVAYLNVAWRDVLAHDTLAADTPQQALLCAVVNDIPCRCAQYAGRDTARRHLLRCFADMWEEKI